MKKLDQFILKSFVGPFIAILLVVVFILMMQFLWLYIDELVGKGLSFKVILEFLGWGSATLLPLSLPLATLLSSMYSHRNCIIRMKTTTSRIATNGPIKDLSMNLSSLFIFSELPIQSI